MRERWQWMLEVRLLACGALALVATFGCGGPVEETSVTIDDYTNALTQDGLLTRQITYFDSNISLITELRGYDVLICSAIRVTDPSVKDGRGLDQVELKRHRTRAAADKYVRERPHLGIHAYEKCVANGVWTNVILAHDDPALGERLLALFNAL